MISARLPINRRRGVALLLSLGILALMLVLAMSFAYTARTERLAAENHASLIKARLLCRSGLERALASLKFAYDNTDLPRDYYPASSPGKLFSDADAGSGLGSHSSWRGRSYAVSRRGSNPDRTGLGSALATDLGFPFVPNRPDDQLGSGSELGSTASWLHVMDDQGRLAGRIAFLIIDESGKLDPAAVVSGDQGEPWVDLNGNGSKEIEEFWDLVDGDSDPTTYEFSEFPLQEDWPLVRVGAFPEEIDLRLALPASLRGNRDWFRSKRPPVLAGRTRWFSWMHLFKGVGMDASQASECVKTLFPYSYDRELYEDGGSDRTRFNLFRGDWDAMTPAVILGAVPWLSTMVDKNAVSVQQQVAANLIDYCDADFYATTADYDPETKTASYVGLENVPYINEIGFSAVLQEGTDPLRQRKLTVQADVELINIYGLTTTEGNADHPLTTVPTVELTASFVYTDPNLGAAVPFTRYFVWTAGTLADVNSYGLTGSAASVEGDLEWESTADPAAMPASDQVQDFTVTEVRAAIGEGTVPIPAETLYDCAVVESAPSVAVLARGTPVYISVEVNDPRQNSSGTGIYDDDNWKWKPFVTDLLLPQAPTLGRLNTHATPGGSLSTFPLPAYPPHVLDQDADPSNANEVAIDHELGAGAVLDPALDLSTAYIRNGSPKSLWELGALHRGEPWRTLSLSQRQTGWPAGRYESGDWNLLDQVWIGNATTAVAHGKVNINTPVLPVLGALLDGVRVGGAYAEPAPGTGVAIHSDKLDDLAAAIRNATNPGTGVPFANRGMIGTVAELHDGTGGVSQDTDRKQEEIIGKIANLLTTRQNYFTVIVVAEAVRDIGPVAAPDSVSVALAGGGSTRIQILASQKIMAVVYRDAFRNAYAY